MNDAGKMVNVAGGLRPRVDVSGRFYSSLGGFVIGKSLFGVRPLPLPDRMRNPYRYFKTSPAIIQLVVMMYVRYPLFLRQVEDLLHERGIDVSYEAIRFWWNRFGPLLAKKLSRRQQRLHRGPDNWRWHLDEVFVKIKGEMFYLWRAVDHEGIVLDALVTKKRDRHAALKFLKKQLKWYRAPETFVTDRLASYRAALRRLGIAYRQEVGRHTKNRA